MIRFVLTVLGSVFLGALLHELYHWMTVKEPLYLCYEAGTDSFMSVISSGNSTSSELVAYSIITASMILGLMYAIWDYRK